MLHNFTAVLFKLYTEILHVYPLWDKLKDFLISYFLILGVLVYWSAVLPQAGKCMINLNEKCRLLYSKGWVLISYKFDTFTGIDQLNSISGTWYLFMYNQMVPCLST